MLASTRHLRAPHPNPKKARARAAGVLLGAAMAGLAPGVIMAQDQPPAPPTAAERVAMIGAAFDQVALRAEAGSWQAADAAYNEALAVMDGQGPTLQAELGDPARSALAEVEGLLPRMVDALDAEDASGVRAVEGLIRTALHPLAPDEIVEGPPLDATELVLGWRDGLEAALAAGAAGGWNDMRDGAAAVAASMARTGPTVVRAVGPDAAGNVDRARIFTLRVRAGALDRSMSEAVAAGDVAREAIAALLDHLAGVEAPTPTPTPTFGVRFRPYLVDGEEGGSVVVPIVVENVPDVGLGGFSAQVQWSADALELVDVVWDVGHGTVDRAGDPGTAVLTLAQAPTGPSGDIVVARLTFNVVGTAVNPRDYLPGSELEHLESTLQAARDAFLGADVPKAGNLAMQAYLGYRSGAGDPTRLRGTLDEHGLGAPVDAAMLKLLDSLTVPAEPDVILEDFERFDTLLAATIASFATYVSQPGEVPIVVQPLGVTDTRGRDLPTLPSSNGAVRLAGAAAVPGPGGAAATPPASDAALPTPINTLPPDFTAASEPPAQGRAFPRPPVPLPLLLALAVAVLAGGFAVWRAAKEEAPPPE